MDDEDDVPMMNGDKGDISVKLERKRSFLFRSWAVTGTIVEWEAEEEASGPG